MKALSLSDIEAGKRFPAPLFTRDGSLVLLAWQEVDPILYRALSRAGIEQLYLCDTPEEARKLSQKSLREPVDLRDVELGKRLSHALYGEDGRLLLAQGQKVTEGHLALLERRGITRVYRRVEEGRGVVSRLHRLTSEYTLREIVSGDNENCMRIGSSADSMAAGWHRPLPHEREPSDVSAAHSRHIARLEEVFRVLQGVRVDQTVDIPLVHDLARDVVEDVVADHLFSLNLAGIALHNDYLADHSLSVAIVCVALGALVGYPAEVLLDLAIAGLLHDVGMTAVPPELVSKPTRLTPRERAIIERHPEEGLRLIRDIMGLDRHIHFAVYQSHERYGGQGYPKGRKYPFIHDFVRILSIADTYQALITPRPYRKRLLPYRAMEKLLELTRDKYFDPAVMKVFISALGLFPVGSWVRLNTGFIARVVDCAGEDAARPVVSIVTDRTGKRLDKPILLDLSTCRHTKIAGAINEEPYGFDMAAGFHANGPLLPDFMRRDGDEEKWVVPENLMDWSASFAGSLSEFRIGDVIQLLDIAQKSGILSVKTPEGEGKIYLREGQIMKAEYGRHKNEGAVYRLVDAREGTFSFIQKAVDVDRAIEATNTALLLEAFRLKDESTRQTP